MTKGWAVGAGAACTVPEVVDGQRGVRSANGENRGVVWASRLIRTIPLAAACALVLAMGLATDAQARSQKPNIIVITTDDQHEASLTPELMPRTVKHLENAGTRFTDSVVPTPLCCPARATMLTGQYAHNNGVSDNIPGYKKLRDKKNVLPTWLQAAGYRTLHVGKFLNEYRRHEGEVAAPGWDRWFTMATHQFFNYKISDDGRLRSFGREPGDYLTRVLSKRATKWAKRFSDAKKPFYMQVDQFAPHAEYVDSRGKCKDSAIPDPREIGSIGDYELPMSPGFNADNSDKPDFIADAFGELSPAQIAEITRQYQCRVGTLEAVDRGIGNLMRTLKTTGAMRKTIVIFSSDNGYLYGEHRIPEYKHFAYEESIRVPLVIRVPNQFRDGAETTPSIDAPVAWIDLAPTILDYAGAQPCKPSGKCRVMDGRSLRPLLSGGDPDEVWPEWRAIGLELDISLDGRPQPPGMTCAYTGIRVLGQMYVEHTRAANAAGQCAPLGDDAREHYYLGPDPFELDNRYPGIEPADQYAQGELAERLRDIEDCQGIEGRDPEPPPGIMFCE